MTIPTDGNGTLQESTLVINGNKKGHLSLISITCLILIDFPFFLYSFLFQTFFSLSLSCRSILTNYVEIVEHLEGRCLFFTVDLLAGNKSCRLSSFKMNSPYMLYDCKDI